MIKKLKSIKLELFYWRKAVFEYHKFWKYIYNKYFLAPKILKHNKVLEKPINNSDLSIHTLTCHKDFIMTLWSLASYYKFSEKIGQLYIHNDGSLTKKEKNIFKNFFPNSKIIEQENVKTNYNKLDGHLEIKEVRKEKVNKYFLLKKLLDPFLISDKKYVMIIDSDLLWLKNPKEITDEIKNNCLNSLITTNNIKSFIYFKNGEKIADKYFKNFDFNNSKNKHFIEQAGYAFCLNNLKKLPEDKYVINKEINEDVCVKHYTSPRRPLFYIEGLEKIKNEILCQN
jgi:hypothetical protein